MRGKGNGGRNGCVSHSRPSRRILGESLSGSRQVLFSRSTHTQFIIRPMHRARARHAFRVHDPTRDEPCPATKHLMDPSLSLPAFLRPIGPYLPFSTTAHAGDHHTSFPDIHSMKGDQYSIKKIQTFHNSPTSIYECISYTVGACSPSEVEEERPIKRDTQRRVVRTTEDGHRNRTTSQAELVPTHKRGSYTRKDLLSGSLG